MTDTSRCAWLLVAVLAVALTAGQAIASPPFKAAPRRRHHTLRHVAPSGAADTAPETRDAGAVPAEAVGGPVAPPTPAAEGAHAEGAAAPATGEAAAPARIERVRYLADDHSTRVIVLLSRSVPYEVRVLPGERSRGSERRVVLDFSNAKLAGEATRPIGVEDGLLKQIRTGQFTARTARVVLDLASVTGHHVSMLEDPPRVVVDIAGRPAEATRAKGRTQEATVPRDDTAPPADTVAPPPAAQPSPEPGAAAGMQELRGRSPERAPAERGTPQARLAARDARASRQHVGAEREAAERATPSETKAETPTRDGSAADEGAHGGHHGDETASATPPTIVAPPPVPPARTTPWRIVLDPGHGGNDPGTLGVDGVYEKNVTLAIAKRLKRRLEEGLGAQVLLTRDGDETRSLAQRTAFANASNADLFVSIHANADATGELHGIETYTLNNTNDRAAIRLAKMENGPGVRTGRGDLSFILSDMVQSGKEEESIALANRLHRHLLTALRSRYPDVRNLGVKKGPFYVLVGAYMPCVLVETSFLSHPVEGRRLASPAYQSDVVEGLYRGMAEFLADQRLAKTL